MLGDQIYLRTYIRWPAANKFAGTKVNVLLIRAQMMDRATRMGTVNIGRVYRHSGVLYVRVCAFQLDGLHAANGISTFLGILSMAVVNIHALVYIHALVFLYAVYSG